MEYTKFAKHREPYLKALAEFREMEFIIDYYIHHNPSSAGYINLARFLALNETYKQTLGLLGHIAEVCVWNASCLQYYAKSKQFIEPESFTLVHGFDWFKGAFPGPDEMTAHEQELCEESTHSVDENRPRTIEEGEEMCQKISKLIEIQNLDHIVYLYKLDFTKELNRFFEEQPYMQFKIVFLDTGAYEVVRECLHHFWPRLISSGVLILDQFNHEIEPGETRALREYFPNIPLHSFVLTSHPSAYIVKPVPNLTNNDRYSS